MVEKATLGVIIAISLVLALSFKDLMTIKMANASSDEDTKAAKRSNDQEAFGEPVTTDSTFNAKNVDTDDFGDVDSDRLDRDDADSEGEQVAKKIPKLKIKSNVQTIKFLFW